MSNIRSILCTGLGNRKYKRRKGHAGDLIEI